MAVKEQWTYITENQPKIALNHFVSTEHLSTSTVEALVKRTLQIKNMPQSEYPKATGSWVSNLFWNQAQERISASK